MFNYLSTNNSNQLVKYVYYYLLINNKISQKTFIGVELQYISKEYLHNIKILIHLINR